MGRVGKLLVKVDDTGTVWVLPCVSAFSFFFVLHSHVVLSRPSIPMKLRPGCDGGSVAGREEDHNWVHRLDVLVQVKAAFIPGHLRKRFMYEDCSAF